MVNEKRLIYLEDAKEALIGWETDPTDEEIEWTLDQLPKVDAVEVVRCKDCRHLEISGCYGECSRGYLGIVEPWDYCSEGERKDK